MTLSNAPLVIHAGRALALRLSATLARLSPGRASTEHADFETALNKSIGKLLSACKQPGADKPRIKRALAHLNAAKSLHSLGYTSDARTIVARCFHEIHRQPVGCTFSLRSH